MEYEAELRHKNEMKKLEAKMKAQYVSSSLFVSVVLYIIPCDWLAYCKIQK